MKDQIILLRLSHELKEKIKTKASEDKRSVNNFLLIQLEKLFNEETNRANHA